MSIAIAAVFLVLIGLIFLVFPRHRTMQRVDKPLYQLHLEYASVQFRLGAFFLATGVLMGFIAYGLIPLLSMYRLSQITEKLYTFRPAPGMARTAALFFGLFGGALLALCYGRFVLRDRWGEYIVYQSMRFKSLSPALLKYTMVLLGLLAGALTIAATDHFLVFTQNGIQVKRSFVPFVKTYTYDQVEEIREVETYTTFTGKVVYAPHLVLLFNNEEEWNFRSEGLFPPPRDNKDFVSWLLNTTNKKLLTIESE